MKNLLHKSSILIFFLYVTSVFICSYSAELNYISQIIFILLFGVTFFYVALKGSLISSPGIYMQGIFLGFIILSYYWIMADVTSFNRVRTLFLLILLMTVVINIITDKERLDTVIKLVFFAGVTLCIYSLIFYGVEGTLVALSGEEQVRLGAEVNQANIFGMITTIASVIGLYYAYYKGQGFYYILTVIPLVFSFASGSRKVILILLLTVVILIFSKKGKSTLSTILITLFSVTFVVMIINYISSLDLYILKRFDAFLAMFKGNDQMVDTSSLTRLEMIKCGLKWFSKKPLLGYGTDQYGILYAQTYGMLRYSHCNMVEVLVNHGIIGFLAYYSIYIYMLSYIIKAMRKKVEYSVLMLLIMAIFLVLNIFTVILYEKTAFILYGIVLSYINIYKKEILAVPSEKDVKGTEVS